MRKSTNNLTDRWLVAGSLDLNGKTMQRQQIDRKQIAMPKPHRIQSL